MDINSLLSPQDSPRQSPGPSQIPPKRHRKSKSSKATQPTDLALANPTPTSTDFIHNATLQAQPIIPSPPMIHPASALRSAATNISSTVDSSRSNRQPSTPGMDTLADLASMQHHQQATRANAGGLRSTDIYESHSSTNPALPTLQGVSGALSGRSPLDTAMADRNPQASPPRTYSTASLSNADRQTVAQLVAFLSSNQFAYESHVELIRLLHLGFRAHIYPTSPSAAKGDPHTYELLPDLQSAREAMDARFALGEDLWVDLIEDQRLLATTPDECVTVMESCQKAVKEEAGSTKLWFLYAEWILSLYKAANPQDQRIETLTVGFDENKHWSDEDKAIIREVWSWQHIMDVLAQGTQATKWRIDDSHLLWSIYTELLLQDLSHSPSPDAISSMEAHFIDRLNVPHSAWDETFQTFSNFISQYRNSAYENIMTTVNQQCRPVKEAYEAREMMELNVKRAQESSDKAAEWQTFSEYIEWELAQSRKKGAFVFELVDALYQRATLRFPTNTELWEGYIMFLNNEHVTYSRPDIPLLSVLDQSTRHCPWSGTLWSQYLLAAELQNMLFTDIDQIKHKATSTGLLDAGGLEEILQVYVAWCSFLRRRAFQQESTDEELDVAEVGIRSAIEDMHRLGEAKYGKEYQGDPEYRLERVYIKYLTQSRNWRAARESWKRLISKHGDSHEFWLRYYLWEMSTWGTEDANNTPVSPRPSEATKALRTGLRKAKLDWPERLLQALQTHCEDHENAEELRSALVQIWKTSRIVKKRRETEAIEAYKVAQAQALQQTHSLKPEPSEDSTLGFPSAKRKREASKEDGDEEMAAKRTRAGEESQDDKEIATETTSNFKRDRENATIITKNLPRDVKETKIRQYFRDVRPPSLNESLACLHLCSAGPSTV
ncbi:MAG: hypothetical protein Q9214_001585 [Letrouitia sp. 1 TL-2023]